MAQEIRVPSVGESVSKGILAAWLKGDGERVEEGEEIFELETEKATMAIPAPASGVLEIRVQTGQEVSVDQVVGAVREGEPIEAAERAEAPEAAPAVEPAPAPASEAALSPSVRRIVAEHGLNPGSIPGTGPGGKITREDALKAARSGGPRDPAAGTEGDGTASGQAAPRAGGPLAGAAVEASPSAPPALGAPAAGEVGRDRQSRVPLSPLRRRIAENLVRSRQASAHLTTFNEVDLQEVMDIRSRFREEFESEHGVRIGFMSFFVKACCRALREFPEVNARLEGDELVYNHFYDIGVAVSTERGLLVPVLRDAERMSFAGIEQAILDMARRAREKKLTPDELTGGTFTITNGGVFGSLLSTPIPNHPQTAVLGMHAIQKRPVAVEDRVVIRPMMYVALTYDHRVIDGREAVLFLGRIKGLVEDPHRLLLET